MLTQSDLERERCEARWKLEHDRISEDAWIQELRSRKPEEWQAVYELVGRVHAYQELLGIPPTPMEDLVMAHRVEDLKRLVEKFKQKLRR